MTTTKVPIITFLVLLSIALLGFLLVSGNKQASMYNSERFYADPLMQAPDAAALGVDGSVAAKAPSDPDKAASGFGSIYASDPNGNESYSRVKAPAQSGPMPTCFPRDRLTADDLLPKDAANSKWAQLNPAGQGDVRDQNFLTAGYHIGVNTTGSSKKNPNLQLRSEPLNPQVVVSPWMQSTIEPNLYQRPLEIGSGDY
jgi:hypothetical protein